MELEVLNTGAQVGKRIGTPVALSTFPALVTNNSATYKKCVKLNQIPRQV